MNKKSAINKVALFLALLFHVCGMIGILFTSYKEWFIKSTAYTLLLMALLLVLTHTPKNKRFFIFLIIVCIIGFSAEVIGVNTGILFGEYSYGDVLGTKVLNVPLVIAVNWFNIIYCAGMITQSYEQYMIKKMKDQGMNISHRLQRASFVVDAVLLVLLFDWIMEPVAVKLGYWQWQNNDVSGYNYFTWAGISIILFVAFRKLNKHSRNIFAINLFIIQLLFFLALRTFL
jgi:bisanhydrobacterioruberin hydratase